MSGRHFTYVAILCAAACGGTVVVDRSSSSGSGGSGGAGGLAIGVGGVGVTVAGVGGTVGTTAVATSAFTVGPTSVSTSSTGSGLGCPASDPPANATIAFGMGGIVSNYGGIAAYGGSSVPLYSAVGTSMRVTENAMPSTVPQYVGVVLFFSGNQAGTDCLDAHAYSGVGFDISGTLSGCTLSFSIDDSEHEWTEGDPKASGPAGSYPPELQLPAAQLTMTPTHVKVPFAGVGGPVSGSPATDIDPTRLLAVQWNITIPANTSVPCTSDFTISNVAFY